MINLILFGPPGSGKGTQAELIVKKEKLTHISTGDIFRKHISKQTELGIRATSYMQKREYLPAKSQLQLLPQSVDSCIHSK